MSKAQDFIVELGTEELPPKELNNLATSFAASLQEQLIATGITYGPVTTYATPRRLAVYIQDLEPSQPEQKVEKRGPALNAAFNPDGSPTKAAEGFASSCGVAMEALSKLETDKGTWLYYESVVPGNNTVDLLPSMIEHALKQLPVKKAMRWGNGELSFVRPVQWLLMLYGKTVVSANIMGLQADNITYGHRIHAPKGIRIASANQYADKLEKDGKVIADFVKRKEYIRQQIVDIAQKQEAMPIIDADLLNMVTGLVEHPVALLANFAPEFLRVPKECLISAMQDHQKCFGLLDQTQNLLPKFIVISNLTSSDPATVIRGNELVMHARLADAAFHYDSDLQKTLQSRVEKLKSIIYQQQLGSIFDKTERIAAIALHIASQINADNNTIKRSAALCKADLVTNMVYEFPELQGIMGYYYALHDKEPTAVAEAIVEHYKPRFAQDDLPTSPAGIALAIADRVDSLVGLFGIGKAPTGEKDPFALRRQALAILKILIERNISLNLHELFTFAANQYGNKIANDPTNDLLTFCFDRLKAWYLTEDVPAKVFAAVMANNPNNPLDFHRRINAVLEFQALPAAESLAAANKRVHNILQKSTGEALPEIDIRLLITPEEKALYYAMQDKTREITPLLGNADYTAILKSLAALQMPVDNFFTNVMVNTEEQQLRNNRLHMLHKLRNLFLQVADVSLL